ncbi:hypothetical protein RF11_02198 [Thelohanellus kitauei]|uniref:Uncharacterized protein n=1 Tax=Thelohanellus kitauei TaxID=669202 RepID=A0A0C2MG93_THEKT|nr:hypothetical protein RF11_02198 [Thelohanellus kitauei]
MEEYAPMEDGFKHASLDLAVGGLNDLAVSTSVVIHKINMASSSRTSPHLDTKAFKDQNASERVDMDWPKHTKEFKRSKGQRPEKQNSLCHRNLHSSNSRDLSS